jgi:putative CocE/NonD family hydrolase
MEREIREIETLWIPMPDGVRLAARAWIPVDAESEPVPAILEYIPYRRRDGTREGDEETHPWWARQGYACIRLDIRGSGDSEGVIRDEYLAQEQDDAVAAIAWLAAQRWCSGKVGMVGISWGGFNGLQVAARRPPALGAIITLCSTDDRYADDMHYMGGVPMGDNLVWGSMFFAIMARAPDPDVVGQGWREQWMARLEAVEPVFARWLEHPLRDAYWRHGSVCEDFSAIRCPVMAVGGWADGYSNAVFRLLAGLEVPRLGIVGPWGHRFPHDALPGPGIGFLQEGLRWWDRWLKGRDTGIEREPMLRAWLQDGLPPQAHYDERPGSWVAEPAWPSPRIAPRALALAPGRLADTPQPDAALAWRSPETVGAAAGEWCPYGLGGESPEMPLDQRTDDALSLCFDGAPLPEPLDILGAPVAELELAVDRPTAFLCARLCEVAPDGASTRVSFGILNLTHDAGHGTATTLRPGERRRIRLQLNEAGHRFRKGCRLRLALSTAYWPIVWPSPEPVTLTLFTSASRLLLPVRSAAQGPEAEFPPPLRPASRPRTVLRPGRVERRMTLDIGSGRLESTVLRDDGRSRIDAIGVETDHVKELRYSIHPDDPTAARAETRTELVNAHPGWNTRIAARTAITCDRESFHVEADLEAFEDGRRVFARSWTLPVRRRGN